MATGVLSMSPSTASTLAASSSSSSITAVSMSSTHARSEPSLAQRQASAWRYEGYRGFSRFMASSTDFCVLQRFSALQVRVLLQMQDEIKLLEQEMEDLDQGCMMHGDWRGRNDSIRFDKDEHDVCPRRMEILRQLRPLLKDYNDLFSSFSSVRSRASAKPDQLKNVNGYFACFPNAIMQREREFLKSGIDVVPLVSSNKSVLETLVETWCSDYLSKLFPVQPRVGRNDYEGSGITYHNTKLKVTVLTFVVIFTGLIILLAPVWLLNFVLESTRRLGIITAFIVFFSIVLTVMLPPKKPFEVLAGTAAYAAVLMVYMQQTTPSPPAP